MIGFTPFDQLFDPVLAVNAQGELVYFNNQACIFFKQPPRVLKQSTHLTNLCQSDELNLNEWIQSSLKSDVSISPEIKISLNQDETEYFVILKLIPYENNFVIVFHDTTVEKNLHSKYREQLEELKKTHSQILQADKLSTIGELTANISHEINNPLTIATGHCELIRDFLSMPNPEKKIKHMQSAAVTLGESLDRVNQIIKGMKEFLHQNEEKKEYCNLEEVIQSAVNWTSPSTKKTGVVINLDIKNSAVALVNRIKIEQVLINLIKNSIDAISEAQIPNGEIKITLKKSEGDQQTLIDVMDNGPGMPLSMKENVFKPFQSTKDVGEGTGLGLSICSKIVESHQGKLEYIDSQSGCHFRIKLPLIEVYSYTSNDRSLTSSKKQKRILVLDNEVQILNVLNAFVYDEGFVFVGSSDPHRALSFLNKASVDLIVTDFNMPIMNGNEFASKARENGFSGPILYMTSSKYIDQYNKDKNDLDIAGVIIKPFGRDEVMKSIKEALRPKEGLK